MKLSALIITKNEEDQIKDCIDSVSFADEIIVVDNNSTDRTIAQAKKKRAYVYQHTFKDFASQRSFAIKKAKGTWILYVDADERVSDELAREIVGIVNNTELHYNAYFIPRHNVYFGKYAWPGHEKLERLFLKSKLKGWKGKIHESPIIEGTVGSLQHHLIHYSHRNLSAMTQKTNEWSKIESDLLLESNHPKMEGWRFFRIMITKFYDSYITKSGYKAGLVGLIESIFQAYSYLVVYAKLWEKQLNRTEQRHG